MATGSNAAGSTVAVLAAAVAILAVLTTACADDGSTAAPGSPLDDDGDGLVQVVLWGDSLAFASRDVFLPEVHRGGGVDARTRTAAGTAICDHAARMAEHAGEVELAVLVYSGNTGSSCMETPRPDLAAGADVVDRYEADLRDVLDGLGAGGATVLLVGAPDAGFEAADGERHRVRAMFEAVAAELDDVAFVDAGAALREDGGFTETLPCLGFEDESLGCGPDGRIIVRSPDQLHFCPNEHPPDPAIGRCDVWSSGAYRFGTAIATAVRDLAGLPTDQNPAPGAR